MSKLPLADITHNQEFSIDGQAYIGDTQRYPHPTSRTLQGETAGLSDAQRAQLLVQRNPVPVGNGMVSRGTWLQHRENTTDAYRLILSTGASEYSFIQPT